VFDLVMPRRSAVGTVSDPQVLAAIAEGRLDAFEQIVLVHQHRVYGFCLRMLGSPADAEEVAQDVFVRAFDALRSYPPDRIRTLAIRAWLYRIALNLVRNRLRCRSPVTIPLEPAADEDGPSAWLPASVDEQPEARAVDAETSAELAAALLALPERSRAAIVLHYVQGLSYAEAAEVLGMPIGSVKSDAHRGLALLRGRLFKRSEPTG
jgi:RNA polymerase sigma-70 factor (ECF subfamily)